MTIPKMVMKEQCKFKFITTKKEDTDVGYKSTTEGPAEEHMRETWRSWGGQGGSWGRAQSCLEKWEALSVVLRILVPSDTRLQYCKDVLSFYSYLCVCHMCVEARGWPMVQFPGSRRITGSCEPHNTGPLESQSVCSATESSLHPHTSKKYKQNLKKKNMD